MAAESHSAWNVSDQNGDRATGAIAARVRDSQIGDRARLCPTQRAYFHLNAQSETARFVRADDSIIREE
jgi:hypothetical protein